jgi:hypothetical protein
LPLSFSKINEIVKDDILIEEGIIQGDKQNQALLN